MHFRPATNSSTLRHSVLMLLALAGLAERAALCALPVRLYLMPVLRRAEFAGLALFTDLGAWFSADALRHADLPDAPDDAAPSVLLRLGWRLRAMAVMLAVALCSTVRILPRPVAEARATAIPKPAPRALPGQTRHDTS